jgi:hypothetical protein
MHHMQETELFVPFPMLSQPIRHANRRALGAERDADPAVVNDELRDRGVFQLGLFQNPLGHELPRGLIRERFVKDAPQRPILALAELQNAVAPQLGGTTANFGLVERMDLEMLPFYSGMSVNRTNELPGTVIFADWPPPRRYSATGCSMA